mmetsp:Transcript_63171/g.111892  ORF Transcript_63171/g.111892 Transcript_63171/m.111892 type:complete len:201 (+) Transcript_63171:339-941(+)
MVTFSSATLTTIGAFASRRLVSTSLSWKASCAPAARRSTLRTACCTSRSSRGTACASCTRRTARCCSTGRRAPPERMRRGTPRASLSEDASSSAPTRRSTGCSPTTSSRSVCRMSLARAAADLASCSAPAPWRAALARSRSFSSATRRTTASRCSRSMGSSFVASASSAPHLAVSESRMDWHSHMVAFTCPRRRGLECRR